MLTLLNASEVRVTLFTYAFQDDTSVFYFKELVDDSGCMIDSMLTDKDGYAIDDPILFQKVIDFLVQRAQSF